MKRADFIKAFALGVIALPSAMESACTPKGRTIAEWADSLPELMPSVSIMGGAEAIDYFRSHYRSNTDNTRGLCMDFGVPKRRFILERIPYRYGSDGKIVSPYTEHENPRRHTLNAEWMDAKIELVIAYGGTEIQWAPFYRETFIVVGASK